MQRLILLCLCLSVAFATPLQNNSTKTLLKDIASRIVNGERAREGQFPWQVGLYMSASLGGWFCGGTIISEEWILTAGHCVDGARSGRIIAGVVELNSPQRVEIQVADFITHQDYDYTTANNDIGLLRLGEPLPLGQNIQPIRLADEPLREDVDVTVSGWGITRDNGATVSDFLNFVELRTITNEECQDRYTNDQIFEGFVCADSDEGKSTCSGDSGGPLVVNAGTDPVHVGVVSFVSDEGCEAGNPTGYIRTASYRDWIREHTRI